MVTIARSRSAYGPFESCPRNPILSNRSLESPIQNTGHADLFADQNGRWWAVFLAVRPHDGVHHLGRETCLAAVQWDSDGWPVINGGARITLRGVGHLPAGEPGMDNEPVHRIMEGFGGNQLSADWVYLRNPTPHHYSLQSDVLTLRPTVNHVDMTGSPTAIFRRQTDFEMNMSVVVDFAPVQPGQEAGLVIYRSTRHYAQMAVTSSGQGRQVLLRRRIGSMVQETCVDIPGGPVILDVAADRRGYNFSWGIDGRGTGGSPLRFMGHHESRYLSSEVAGGYIGVMPGLYAAGAQGDEEREPPSAVLSHFRYRCANGN